MDFLLQSNATNVFFWIFLKKQFNRSKKFLTPKEKNIHLKNRLLKNFPPNYTTLLATPSYTILLAIPPSMRRFRRNASFCVSMVLDVLLLKRKYHKKVDYLISIIFAWMNISFFWPSAFVVSFFHLLPSSFGTLLSHFPIHASISLFHSPVSNHLSSVPYLYRYDFPQ